MIRPDGTVRNYRTGLVITPVVRGGRRYVRLFHQGRPYNRGVQKLIDVTFPHVDPYETFEEWVVLPGFRRYEINRSGDIRVISTKKLIKKYTDSGVYVNLHKDGVTIRRGVSGLLNAAWR